MQRIVGLIIIFNIFIINDCAAINRITIIGGAGAIGSYFSLMLSQNHENEVSLILSNRGKAQSQADNFELLIKTSKQEYIVNRKNFKYITTDISDIRLKQDIILVCLKQPNIDKALLEQIKNITDSNSIIFFMGNGLPFYFFHNAKDKNLINSVDPDAKLTDILKNYNIMHMHPLIAASKTSYNETIISRPLDEIKISFHEVNQKIGKEQIHLERIFKESGINLNFSTINFQKVILEKLQFALAINVISALTGATNYDIFMNEQHQEYINDCINFTQEIADKIGIGKIRSYADFRNMKVTKHHKSSLHYDITHNKINEIDAIVTLILRLSNQLKIEPDSNIHTQLELIKNLLFLKAFEHRI